MLIVLKYLTKLTKNKANILKMKTMTDNNDSEHLLTLFEQELTVTFNKHEDRYSELHHSASSVGYIYSFI